MKFQKVMTKCGAPLYVFPMPHAMSIAMGILANVGTRDERHGESGIAHALEHMVFQGNKRLPDSHTITSELEDIGGDINAGTSDEMTIYHCTVPDEALQKGANSLASLVSTPLFREKDIQTEMLNVAEEIKQYRDAPFKYCVRMLNEMVYGDHPLGKDTLGTKESVLGFRQRDFLKFHGDFYHPANYTFVVVGKTTAKKAAQAFDKAFSDLPFSMNATRKNVRTAVPLIRPDIRKRIERRDIEQANVIFGTHTCAATEEDSKALRYYAAMISSGMSFPLFQEVRDKRGLCYSVGAGVDQKSDQGMFYAYIGCDPSRIQEATACIHEVIENSCTQTLFDKTRSFVFGQCKVGLFSDPEAFLNQAVHDIILKGAPRSPLEILADLESRTLKEVKQAVERHLLDKSRYSYAYAVPHGTDI